MCGGTTEPSEGSPLRVQEHFVGFFQYYSLLGITPACAGTFFLRSDVIINSGDHPCVCRNIQLLIVNYTLMLGSPLRVQEHFLTINTFDVKFRITPACAGTFYLQTTHFRFFRDHPCVCRNIMNFNI